MSLSLCTVWNDATLLGAADDHDRMSDPAAAQEDMPMTATVEAEPNVDEAIEPEPDEQPIEGELVDDQMQQPADVVDADELDSKQIELRTPTGALTLDPHQSELTSKQAAALVAIGIDVKTDPLVVPHIRPFIHMCQVRGLDPFAKEAYLIGRGKGQTRKWTMQVAIDGYRRIARKTGRFIRVSASYWTGADDDERSWFFDKDAGVMRRIWFDMWPASRGNPGAAKVVIEHYDLQGNRTETEGIANWEMFAPYTDKWEGPKGNRKIVTGPDGKPVREVTEMWAKGGPHMLAKVAEAFAYRKAFPAEVSGMYIPEEMARTQQDEYDRERRARGNAISAAYERAHAVDEDGQEVETPFDHAPQARPRAQARAHTGEQGDTDARAPKHVADAVNEARDMLAAQRDDAARARADEREAQLTDERRIELLKAEVLDQARIMGVDPIRLYARHATARGKAMADFNAVELQEAVAATREMVVERLRASGATFEATAYAEVEPHQALPAHLLFGTAEGDADE